MHGLLLDVSKALHVCVVPQGMWSPTVQSCSGKSVRMWHMSQVMVEVELALVVLTEVELTVEVLVSVWMLEQ
jgi:predicted aspartyl protease